MGRNRQVENGWSEAYLRDLEEAGPDLVTPPRRLTRDEAIAWAAKLEPLVRLTSDLAEDLGYVGQAHE